MQSKSDQQEDFVRQNSQSGEVYEPPSAFASDAIASDSAIYERADQDFEGFWESWARKLHWDREWDQVLEWKPPWAKWFTGGELNASFNCLDRHVNAGTGSKVAYWGEGEDGTRRTITYAELLDDVCRFVLGDCESVDPRIPNAT